MNIRFYNGKICTLESDTSFTDELWIKDSKVAYAGTSKEAGFKFDREIDLHGNLLIPGFKNAHTHSGMTFLRSFADDLPLLDWLHHQVFPMEAKLAGDDVYWLSRLAILEYLTSGMTANMDMYLADEMAKASIDSGFRTVTVNGLNNFGGSVEESEAEYDRINNKHELVSACLGFHAEYTCSPELLKKIGELVNRRKLPIFTHSSESLREVNECIERIGMTPTAWIDSFGIFNYGGGAYHCVHMSDDDLALMKKRDMAIVSCPGSNTKLASGIARITDMLKLGIKVGIGTDGPASNNCLDMFREMFLMTGLQKLRTDDASALPAEEVLKMACSVGADIMRLPECNSLAAGRNADLTVIDLNRPNMQPINHEIKNLVYSGSKENVVLTMVNGRILYENGEFSVGEKPEYIYKKANEIISRMR